MTKALFLIGLLAATLGLLNHAADLDITDTSKSKGEISLCDVYQHQGQTVTLRGIVTNNEERNYQRMITVTNAAQCSVVVTGNGAELDELNEVGNKVSFVAQVSGGYLKNVRSIELDETIIGSSPDYRTIEGKLLESPSCWEEDNECYLRIQEKEGNTWKTRALIFSYAQGRKLRKGQYVSIKYTSDYQVVSVK